MCFKCIIYDVHVCMSTACHTLCIRAGPVLAKLVPVGYGIKKLQITTVVEDDKVSTDDLEEQICAFEDYVSITLICS